MNANGTETCETCNGEGKLYCDGCGGHLCPDPVCGDPTCPNPHYCPDDCDGTTPDCPECVEHQRWCASNNFEDDCNCTPSSLAGFEAPCTTGRTCMAVEHHDDCLVSIAEMIQRTRKDEAR